MFCSQCGTKNVDNAKFCFNCGSPLYTESAESQTEQQKKGLFPNSSVTLEDLTKVTLEDLKNALIVPSDRRNYSFGAIDKSYGAMDEYLKNGDSTTQGEVIDKEKEDEMDVFRFVNSPSSNENSLNEKQFALHQVIDTQHDGVVALVFEHPVGWRATSYLVWNFQNVSFPVCSFAKVVPSGLLDRLKPHSASLSFWFPGPLFFWVEPNYGLCQQGQNILGAVYLQPMSAVDAMTRWVVPNYSYVNKLLIPNTLKIVSVVPIPQLAQRIGMDLKGLTSEDVCLKIEYEQLGGQTFEEEIYGIKFTQNLPYYGPMGMTMQINWGFARLFSFQAEKGSLDAEKETFWRIACSVKPNPLWEQLYAQILQELQMQFNQYIQMGYSQIQDAGQLSRAISANSDAWLSAFEQQRQAARQSSHSSSSSSSDRSPSDAFSEYIRGVETCDDPYYGESQQDYNYSYHWTDGFGNYQHSNDPFFNPNIGSNQNWTFMEPKKK
ncbi:MAG: zinc ribbon domain-containing protein [Microcystis wesenbergii Mw_QC_B_20070930_S4]|jgi:hypothetical protein|nr:MAG: zinc ribbon domain-containing protein [Microcystis wesenbergii Mw_QC_B_20070930_S4D]TRV17512.1 MAG: zinc ribbon domain-containing protein [Microcystis wesenbergii Mw_QC_B_20070930_S4]